VAGHCLVPAVLAAVQHPPGVDGKKEELMMQLICPIFGDLMFDGIGLAGLLFALFLIWEALKEWRIRIRRARTARERARAR